LHTFRLKRIFTCAALRSCCSKMSCTRCCAKLSCRGCCSKISCACCCPCFAKCARCSPCCKKCCKKGAVGDSTPNPLDEKSKSQPSLQSKRKSRTLPPDVGVRKINITPSHFKFFFGPGILHFTKERMSDIFLRFSQLCANWIFLFWMQIH